MTTPKSPPGSARRHGRNISHPVPERATRGPLEAAIDDPLAASEPASNPSVASPSVASPPAATQSSQASGSPKLPLLPEPALAERPQPVDLSFLQDHEIYHPLTTEEIPTVFLSHANQPPLDASLSDLIQGGHFRRAAEAAASGLLQSHPDAGENILQLLYTRLACLILISRPDLAGEESAPLVGLLTRNPPGTQDVVALIPWDLRLLLVRLQSIGAVDGGRRGIMALYSLSSEVRSNLRSAQTAGDKSEMSLWSNRLRDLGLRICDALVEMGELETATRHLDTLVHDDVDEVLYRKALLRIRVGDVSGARRSALNLRDEKKKKGFEALLHVADGDYSEAVQSWQSLVDEYPGHEEFALNAAVSLLYTGHIISARDALEDMAHNLPMFPTLLFNLTTVYELCTERAVERKSALVVEAADRKPGPDSGGWERAMFEFKL